jgi:hypothetical protein
MSSQLTLQQNPGSEAPAAEWPELKATKQTTSALNIMILRTILLISAFMFLSPEVSGL